MSQFGMQMPGGHMQRGPSLNVYTGLLFMAFVALLAACGFLFIQGGKIGRAGVPYQIQTTNSLELPAPK